MLVTSPWNVHGVLPAPHGGPTASGLLTWAGSPVSQEGGERGGQRGGAGRLHGPRGAPAPRQGGQRGVFMIELHNMVYKTDDIVILGSNIRKQLLHRSNLY